MAMQTLCVHNRLHGFFGRAHGRVEAQAFPLAARLKVRVPRRERKVPHTLAKGSHGPRA